MKKLLMMILVAGAFIACDNTSKEDKAEMKDPTQTQPVSDAIPDSLKLVGNSTIVPDTTPNNGSQTGRGDEKERQKK